jgi:hypothetical protein
LIAIKPWFFRGFFQLCYNFIKNTIIYKLYLYFKETIKMKKILLVLLFGLFINMAPMAYAQDTNISPITLELKDAPIRTSLEMLFKQGGVQNYVIDNNVAGFVSMNIKDLPFETALKLIMRAAAEPLTYIKENGVYIVKVRIITPTPFNPVPDITTSQPTSNVIWERIPLTFIDPVDLMSVLGPILTINQFSRYTGGMMGGMGNGGFGGGFGSAGGLGGGSMGGFGGAGMGNGNGMGGGAMGGFGGMMGSQGGMGGGMGGFGGGRNF